MEYNRVRLKHYEPLDIRGFLISIEETVATVQCDNGDTIKTSMYNLEKIQLTRAHSADFLRGLEDFDPRKPRL